MTGRDPSSYTEADLRDPNIAPATLLELAQARPDLWTAILGHPSCYPELADHIRRQTSAPPPPQQAPADQMAAGAKQFAAGAREFFDNRVAPAAQGAARSVQQAVNEQRGAQPPGPTGLMVWAPFVLPVAAFLALVSLFLPAASAFGMSVSFFDEEAGGEGAVLLIMMLGVIVTAVLAIVMRTKRPRITAGVVGIVVGFFGAVDGFGTMANVSDMRGASVGAGAVLLAIMSVVVLAAATVTLLPQRQAPMPPPPAPPMG